MNAAVQSWYREPWTWLLVGLPAVAVVASLSSAFLAIQGADPVIDDNYYQRGLDINATLRRVSNAAALGLHASVQYDGLEAGQSVWVGVRSVGGVKDPALQIRLVHPARSGVDLQAVLARVPGSSDSEAEYTGQWLASGPNPLPASRASAVNWRIALVAPQWQVEGDVQGRNDLSVR